MPKPVYLMTVQEAHKKFNSLMDKIRAKYEHLDSGEAWSPGILAFDAEACELAHLLARVSKLCIKLNLPFPKELYRPHSSSIEDTFQIKIQYGQAVCWGVEDAALFP